MEHKFFAELDYDKPSCFVNFELPYLIFHTMEEYFENIFKEFEKFCLNEKVT